MLTSLRVEGFRGLKSLSVEKLARVNLFVGGNNSGKTSLLEAAYILLSRGAPWVMEDLLLRRHEVYTSRGEIDDQPDFSHLFAGHATPIGATFTIKGMNDRPLQVTLQVIGAPDVPMEILRELQIDAHASEQPRDVVRRMRRLAGVEASPAFEQFLEVMSSELGDARLVFPVPGTPLARAAFVALTSRASAADLPARRFLTTERMTLNELASLWGELVLSPEEAAVLVALRIIDPSIDRLAFVNSSHGNAQGILLTRDGGSRVPLGSKGEGITRILSLILSLVHARGGYLLVDEIDTGLHHSVMMEVWKLIVSTAERLSVQVFATTHSMDCLNALGALYLEEPSLSGNVLLHRVEKQYERTTTYRAEEFPLIAEDRIEVR